MNIRVTWILSWLVGVAFGFMCFSACTVGYAGGPQIDVHPPHGMSERLTYEDGTTRISIWNCGLIADDVNTLYARVLSFKGSVCTVLGEVSLPLYGRTPGTIYFPWHERLDTDGESVGQPYFPAIGIAAEDITRHAPLKLVELTPGVSFEYSLSTKPSIKRRIREKSEEAVWVFVFSKPPKRLARPLRVDEIVKPSPFDDTDLKLDAIRKVAARLTDSMVIVVTLRAE